MQRWNVNDTSDWQKFQAELQAERKGDTDLAAKCEQKENTYAEKRMRIIYSDKLVALRRYFYSRLLQL